MANVLPMAGELIDQLDVLNASDDHAAQLLGQLVPHLQELARYAASVNKRVSAIADQAVELVDQWERLGVIGGQRAVEMIKQLQAARLGLDA